MLLGIPGDNTYSNYSEAQRAFWRGTVLPLVNRMAKGFSAWLAPAYGGGVELRPDLDQVEGLSAEREALWARIERASFLTQDEKRAAVGYGVGSSLAARDSPFSGAGRLPSGEPAAGRGSEGSRPRAAGEPAPFGSGEALFGGAGDSPAGSRPPAPTIVKYSPDQPRVPAGNSDGGQWTDGGNAIGLGAGGSAASGSSGGSSSGRVRLAQADNGTRNDAGGDLPGGEDPSQAGRSFEIISPASEPPDEGLPQIPKDPPPSKRKGASLAKSILAGLSRAGKLAQVLAGATPAGRAVKIAALALEHYPEVSDWVEENVAPYLISYFDEPKDIETLHRGVANPARGYEKHHIVEQDPARNEGFPRELIEGRNNLVRIPTLKHWEITGWFSRPNEEFNHLSPREYLRGKAWEERWLLGRRALIEHGVLKP